MRKLGLIGALLAAQTKLSSGCHPDVHLVKEEEKCMRDMLQFQSHHATENNSIHCKGMWDSLNCWPPASIGETVSQPCPDFFNAEGKVYRNCTANGWTDPLVPHVDACSYSFNETLPEPGLGLSHLYYSYVKTMYTVGYAISLVSLTIAVTIFCLFRKLHCTRNYIHIQLFISFILRAIFIFIRDPLLFTNEELYHCDYHPQVACKVVVTFSNYSILANYSWLLVEGHFLFTQVSRSFFSLKKHFVWYLILGWGIPVIIILSWGCVRYFYEDEGCWESRRLIWILYILRAPILLSIFMNLIFFLGILRILMSKLRMPDAQRNEFSQYKRLIKSTFSLVALFGLQYILFVFFPDDVSNLVFQIKTFAELALASTQGFVVAVRYFFMNGEVQLEIQRRWRRWMLTQNLPSRPRQHRSSISQSHSPHTQVSLLPCSPGSPTTRGPPMDTLEVI